MARDEHLERRAVIMAALWRSVDAAPPERPPAEAGARAAAELLALVHTMDGGEDADEVGRTWKYVGDAYYVAAAKADQASLRAAKAAYERALGFLGGDESVVQRAKTLVNLANTLCFMTETSDGVRFARAAALYREALPVFRRSLPDEIHEVRRSLAACLVEAARAAG